MIAATSHIGRDQYGVVYWLGHYPREELCQRRGRQHADKIYCAQRDGTACHIGYVIAGLWIEVHQVRPLEACS